MASKLCCNADHADRSDSPDLPNARLNGTAPVKPLLLHLAPSTPNSHFTSARTDELHELRQIFDNAKDDEAGPPARTKAGRARFIRPSVYSLHSLHKMKSMHSILRRKFSKDLPKKSSPKKDQQCDSKNASPANATVLKQPHDGPNLQLKLTKEDLRKDLLSDQKPDQGGYDSDAVVLDDIARNIGRKSPSKRPSVHSIEWTPSTMSKPTPGSSSKSRHSSTRARHAPPYELKRPQSTSFSACFSHVFSTPNFQIEISKGQERKLKRSHSATSIQLAPSSISPMQLPSLDTNEDEGVPWSVALNERLRLADPPATPAVAQKQPRRSLDILTKKEAADEHAPKPSRPSKDGERQPSTPATVVQIRVQEPTAAVTPRSSASIRDTVPQNKPPPPSPRVSVDLDTQGEAGSRASVHLYSMRISHHLRSGSLLSWETLADAPDRPHPPLVLRDRSVSDFSHRSHIHGHHSRHERQTSSSGFASAKVPSKWGNVVTQDVREDKSSSIYSSRPQSRPESFGGSMIHLPQDAAGAAKDASIGVSKIRRSNSYPTDNEDTPRPVQRHGMPTFHDVTSYSAIKAPSTEPPVLARNNSVSSTKKSKFREEFSPSPPKKRLMPSASFMKFLNPKRSSVRSQNETAVEPPILNPTVDGMLELPTEVAIQRDRRASKSMASMNVEQKALGHDKKASPMWDQALKAHQEERMAMFLPSNREMATQSSLVRVRRGSVLRRPSSSGGESPTAGSSLRDAKQFPDPQLSPPIPPTAPGLRRGSSFFSRRTAFVSQSGDMSPGAAFKARFNQQTDDILTVGAWGCYPSHSRKDRTLSAGREDNVDSRDFALEAAIRFAMGQDRDADEDEIDPGQHPLTPPLLPGEKKRKKKIGHARMAKSNSMTFGKSFLKNYAKMFRSQSIEFHRHGHGHRSSVSTGGHLQYPELEMVPGYWPDEAIKEGNGEQNHGEQAHDAAQEEEYGPGDRKGKGKLKEDGSNPTIRAPDAATRAASTSPPRLDGPSDVCSLNDSVRVLSASYESCLPAFPRASTDLDFHPEEFGRPARHSLDGRHVSMPDRLGKHGRNTSRVSRVSVVSKGSGRPSHVSSNEQDGEADVRSIVSVRRSTMDLIDMYKRQEVRERERVLSLVRAESRWEAQGGVLAGL